MMTQKDYDEHNLLMNVVKYGTIIGKHPMDGDHRRHWHSDENGGCWLYPGEFVLDHEGKQYIVGMRAR